MGSEDLQKRLESIGIPSPIVNTLIEESGAESIEDLDMLSESDLKAWGFKVVHFKKFEKFMDGAREKRVAASGPDVPQKTLGTASDGQSAGHRSSKETKDESEKDGGKNAKSKGAGEDQKDLGRAMARAHKAKLERLLSQDEDNWRALDKYRKNWPKGTIVIHDGREARTDTEVDYEYEVILKFKDGSTSSWVPVNDLTVKWPVGCHVRCNGRFGTIIMPPDSDEEVKLYWGGNNLTSSYINVKELDRVQYETQCPHCSRTVQRHGRPFDDGRTIKCPYETCRGSFQKLKCPSCDKVNLWKQADHPEGSVSACWNCKTNFAGIGCPRCHQIMTRSGNNARAFTCGGVTLCPYQFCGVKFAFIDCYHCKQVIHRFGSSRSDTVQSFSSGKVLNCPYANCKKSFQVVDCPHCDKKLWWGKANYKQGVKTECWSCKKDFAVMACPHCDRDIIRSRGAITSFTNGDPNKCPYEDCRKEFAITFCTHCDRAVWRTEAPIRSFNDGRVMTCPYDDCRKKEQRLDCPHCGKSNCWMSADHIEGAKSKCRNCQEDFAAMPCPHCSQIITRSRGPVSDFGNGNVNRCPYENCRKQFAKVKCLHCNQLAVRQTEPVSTFADGRKMVCPYKDCGRKQQLLNCPHCNIGNWWKDANLKLGAKVNCRSCKKDFAHLMCFHCDRAMLRTSNVSSFNDGSTIVCPYEDCRKKQQMMWCSTCATPNYWAEANRGSSPVCCKCGNRLD